MCPQFSPEQPALHVPRAGQQDRQKNSGTLGRTSRETRVDAARNGMNESVIDRLRSLRDDIETLRRRDIAGAEARETDTKCALIDGMGIRKIRMRQSGRLRGQQDRDQRGAP